MAHKHIPDEFVLDIILKRGIDFARPGEGFRLKHHEEFPDAPLCPFKFHLCTQQVREKEGRLLPSDLEVIGRYLWNFIDECGLNARCLIGVPNAGVPLALVVQSKILEMTGKNVPHLSMQKVACKGRRSMGAIEETHRYPSGPVVLIDDLVMHGESKVEAVESARQQGYGVRDFVVLLDYECGGSEALKKAEVRLFAPLTVRRVFDRAEEKFLDKRLITRARDYLDNISLLLTA